MSPHRMCSTVSGFLSFRSAPKDCFACRSRRLRLGSTASSRYFLFILKCAFAIQYKGHDLNPLSRPNVPRPMDVSSQSSRGGVTSRISPPFRLLLPPGRGKKIPTREDWLSITDLVSTPKDGSLSSKSIAMPRRKKEDELAMSDQDRVPRGAANARERTRMRVLSKAFGRLKLTLPWVPPDTKLSKLDTLRLATSYISHLQRLLSDEEVSSDEAQSSELRTVVVWPFGHLRSFQNGNQRTDESETQTRKTPKSEAASLDDLHTQSFLEDFRPHSHQHPHHYEPTYYEPHCIEAHAPALHHHMNNHTHDYENI